MKLYSKFDRLARFRRTCLLTGSLACALGARAPASAGVLFTNEFTNTNTTSASSPLEWPNFGAFETGETSVGTVNVTLTRDSSRSDEDGLVSNALRVDVDPVAPGATWGGGVRSGRIRVDNSITDLRLLTLSFDAWVSEAKPIRVTIRSYSSLTGVESGSRNFIARPPVAKAYYRFSLDLSAMKPAGGTFSPTDQYVEVFFSINNNDTPNAWSGPGVKTLRIDNVNYSSPKYYVSPTGSDTGTGLTQATAFKTIQRALDAAQAPGDVVLVLPGDYKDPRARGTYVADFRKRNSIANGSPLNPTKGTPANWVVLRGLPGETKPRLIYSGSGNNGGNWDILIADADNSYIEVRDLAFKGNRADATFAGAEADYNKRISEEDNGRKYFGTFLYNAGGITIEGRKSASKGKGSDSNNPPVDFPRPHHFRIINNEVYDNPGAGITLIRADYVTVERNVVYNNCWFMSFAGSGISLLQSQGINKVTTHKNFVVSNTAYRNQCYVKWALQRKISDGNGIIIDRNTDIVLADGSKVGRTLVANNVLYGNGGSGAHAFLSANVDFLHNTAYLNGQSPATKYGQIFAQAVGTGNTLANNIMWSLDGQAVNTVGANQGLRPGTKMSNNLYYDGDTTLALRVEARGDNPIIADPQFVNAPPVNALTAYRLVPPSGTAATIPSFDLRLKSDSVAKGKGALTITNGTIVSTPPPTDREGKARPATAPDLGAYTP